MRYYRKTLFSQKNASVEVKKRQTKNHKKMPKGKTSFCENGKKNGKNPNKKMKQLRENAKFQKNAK